MKAKESPSTITTRREFCAQACYAASLAAAGVLLTACGGGNPTSPSGGSAPALPSVSGTVAGRTVSVSVNSSPLATVGNAALVQTSLGSFLVARVAQDNFTALTAVCTHEAQTVTGFADGRYVCNIHGSEFSTSGAVVMGPANRALRSYTTTVAGDVVSFTV